MPIRVFESYDSFDKFTPMLYDQYWAYNQLFSSICFGELENAWSLPEVSNFICKKMGFAAGLSIDSGDGHKEGDMMMMVDMSVSRQSLDLTSYEESTGYWEFTPTMNYDCMELRDEVVVECQPSGLQPGCLQSGDQCATDLDCCDQMFCCPVTGSCLDPVELMQFMVFVGKSDPVFFYKTLLFVCKSQISGCIGETESVHWLHCGCMFCIL